MRGNPNRSFQVNVPTEATQNDISMIMGSAVSAQQNDGNYDEDIVMDSGGRQINQMNNWVDPYRHKQHNLDIQDGIKNKNLITSGRPYSAY